MLTMDEARGIAAGIWTRTNNKRKIMDPQLCEDIADVLVDEISKLGLYDTTTPKLKELQDQNEKFKTEILNLRSINEKAELDNGNLKQAQLEVANLKTELDTLKLNLPVPKDEVV